MKKIIGIVMVLLMLMSVTVALAGNAKDTQTGGEKVKVIIGYVDKPNHADEDMIRGNGGKTKYTYNIINAKAVEIPEQAIDRIKNNPRVAYVEEDAKVYALEDTLPWGVDRIDAELVWNGADGGCDVTTGRNAGDGVNVSIIDTGIDYSHPDLSANYVGGIGYREGVVIDPMDDHGHGTHCAGIVAAADNGDGVIGVAPEVDLYAVKVLNQYGTDYYGYDSDIVAGIEWSITNGMQIISMSLGSNSPSEAIEDACDKAHDAGIVVVASAGNSGNPRGIRDNVGYPAAYNSVIAVAATDPDDVRARWSSTGPDVELAAPGVDILSTYLSGGYAYMSGTSMACPHVAGTAALMIASGISDNDAVRTCLQETAADLGASGRDNLYGYGLINADEAVQPTVPNTPPVADAGSDQTALVNESVTFNGSGSYDIDGTITNYEWEFGDGTTGTGVTTTHAYGVAGTYTVKLTVTDNDGLTGTDTVMVAVTEEPAYSTIHVASIDMSFKTAGPNRNAIALVKIVDAADEPVEGATVYGTWSNETTDTDSGLTGASGEVSLKSNKVKNALSGTVFTFTVDSVSLTGWGYNQTANVETSDSITV